MSAPVHRPIRKLLVANRGEIACRIIRTAARMGIRTVAVFSDADRDALHLSMADEGVRIGPAPARESYLKIDGLIAAARQTGADAIHPGYGFLSESEAFAEAVEAAGLVFVGPPVAAIRAMGSKSAAKALMAQSGVPLVPGYHGEAQDDETLRREAERIGFPVLIKASAGGGGKGMRLVEDAAGLAAAIASAKREAASAFGDASLLIEKYVTAPRHIEVQVFGDRHGNIVSLFERECTLQRRHQKVVEEAPSSILNEEQRDEICAAARAAAAAVGYVGAGTVEFVLGADGFYFIEMNTRLQVEHPVTEAITGLDLVQWQLDVAAGRPLPLGQHEITRNGHAFEARIYAEDPQGGFLPSIGRIAGWRQPAIGDGVRIDTGFRKGDMVTPYYDPMLAKLIVHGSDRQQALERLSDALAAMQITGLKTNLGFLQALVGDEGVRAGRMDTGLIERELARLAAAASPAAGDLAAAAAAVLMRESAGDAETPWDAADGWALVGTRRRRLRFALAGGEDAEAVLAYARSGLVLEAADAGRRPFRWSPRSDGRLDVFFGDAKETISAAWHGSVLELVTPRGRMRLDHLDLTAAADTGQAAEGHLRAPMPGAVLAVLARPGERLKKGAPIIVLEAMKMEHALNAPSDGVLVAVNCKVGDAVPEGAELAEFSAGDGQ